MTEKELEALIKEILENEYQVAMPKAVNSLIHLAKIYKDTNANK